MPVAWNMLAAYPNAGEAFGQGLKQGKQEQDANMAKAAMAALAQDPNNPRALAALARVDPATAMQFRQQQAELVKAQLAQHQDSIIKGAEIIRAIHPTDQASYTHALTVAQQAGIDISQVPQQFDPTYVDGVTKLADALKPQTGDGLHFITPQPGGGAYAYDPTTGGVKTIIQPNDGSQPTGAPANLPHVSDQTSYDAVPPGQQYIGPDGHVRMKGGQAGQTSPATFQ